MNAPTSFFRWIRWHHLNVRCETSCVKRSTDWKSKVRRAAAKRVKVQGNESASFVATLGDQTLRGETSVGCTLFPGRGQGRGTNGRSPLHHIVQAVVCALWRSRVVARPGLFEPMGWGRYFVCGFPGLPSDLLNTPPKLIPFFHFRENHCGQVCTKPKTDQFMPHNRSTRCFD